MTSSVHCAWERITLDARVHATSPVNATESLWCRRLPLTLSLGYAAIGILYIFASDQLLLWLLADPDRLTAYQTVKGVGFVVLTAALLYLVSDHGIKRLRASERAGRLIDRRFRQVIEIANEGVWMLDEAGRTTFVNETMACLLGYDESELAGRPFDEFVDREFRRAVQDELALCRLGKGSQYECRIIRRGGSKVWVIVASSPILDADGTFAGVCKMVTDISARKETEEELRESVGEQRRLLNELDHRVRNNLSSVLGLLQLARTGAPEADAMAESVAGRVRAMSRAYSLLSASGWSGQDLERLVGMLVPGEARDRVRLRGDKIKVPAHQTGALAIVMHELFSNAMRHGALSTGDGSVDIAWKKIEGEQEVTREGGPVRIELEWTERGGPTIASEPTPRAGCRLIEGLVASDLRGRVNLSFPPKGASHRFEIECFWRPVGRGMSESGGPAVAAVR